MDLTSDSVRLAADEGIFHQAIREAPTEPGPYHSYADYLSEDGQEDSAKSVRAQAYLLEAVKLFPIPQKVNYAAILKKIAVQFLRGTRVTIQATSKPTIEISLSGLAQEVSDFSKIFQVRDILRQEGEKLGLQFIPPTEVNTSSQQWGRFYYTIEFDRDEPSRGWDATYPVGYAGQRAGLTPDRVQLLRHITYVLMKISDSKPSV
jgi:uncharacterized protein (TIGR02996 family)